MYTKSAYSSKCTFIYLDKTEYSEKRQGHVQKQCVLCYSKQIRKQTTYFCRTCPDAPALCYPECFDVFHSELR